MVLKMVNNWKKERLSALCEKIADCPHSTPLWTDSGALVLRSQNIRNGRLDLSTRSYTDEIHFEQRSRRARLTGGDLVITREAPMGEVCLIPDGLRCCLGQRMVMLRPDPKKCDSRFLLYSIQSREVQAEIKISEGTGSTVSNLRIPLLEALPIPNPPLPIQRAIAHVLGTLDDLIELNRETNELLEEMARALFKSWFVDFDPVRAKLEGRPPAGMDAATAALFPDHFQDSELGQIPKGWEVVMVKDAFNLTMGQSPPGESYNESGDGLPFYQGCTDFGFRFPTRRKFCTAPTRLAKLGDTLVSVRAPVGDLNMADEECCIGRGVAAVRHKSGATSFTYHSMANFSPEFSVFEGEGTVFGSINKQSFESLRCVSPPSEVVFAYEEIAGKIDDLIGSNLHESRDLATLRDTLLPKLLSGEVKAPAVIP